MHAATVEYDRLGHFDYRADVSSAENNDTVRQLLDSALGGYDR